MNDNQENKDGKEFIEEFLDYSKKRVRRERILESLWMLVVVLIGVSAIFWLLLGEWLQGLNNILWLFIAWVYWRQRSSLKEAAKLVLSIAKESVNYMRYSEMLEQQIQNYKEKDVIAQKVIDNQDLIIKALEQNQKAD